MSLNILQKYHTMIANEAKLLLETKPIEFVIRKQYIDEEIIKNVDRWVIGWTGDPKWLNYGIVYNGKYLNNTLFSHKIIKIIENIEKRKIYMAGFSLLKSNGTIDTHTDEDFIDDKIDNVWHFGIDVPDNCSIIVNNQEIKEENGKLITFKDGYPHSAFNKSNKDRMILYIKFMTYT